jgi:hypothetical protein
MRSLELTIETITGTEKAKGPSVRIGLKIIALLLLALTLIVTVL